MLTVLERSLEGHFDVISMQDPEKVSSAIAEYKPDILMLDITMPMVDGLTLCRQLREDPANDIMPIVFLSALQSSETRLQAFEAGGDDYITKPFSLEELRAKVSVWTRMAVRSREMLRQNRELEALVRTDALTGLCSRRYVLDMLDEEMERYHRYGTPVSVVMIDIDDFKRINDDYGHGAGDEALVAVAKGLEGALRTTDRAARYGGDEFLLVLSNSDAVAAEEVCRKVKALGVTAELRPGVREPLSLSIGGATAYAETHNSTDLIDAADVAMLVAKHGGKGRYHVHAAEAGEESVGALHTLQATRDSMRELLCTILGRTLAQVDRQAEVLGNRTDLMLEVARDLGTRHNLSLHDRQTLKNTILIAPYVKLNLSWEIATVTGGLGNQHATVLQETTARNLDTLRRTGFLNAEVEVLSHIHEWYDGNGFPDGLEGDEIPLLSRMVGVLSAYSLLREGGPHTARHGHEKALEVIQNDAGTHFDPALVTEIRNLLEQYAQERKNVAGGDILVLEDYEPVRRIIAKRLMKNGYGVIEAGSIRAAKDLLPQRSWHAVLTDLMLPDGSGLDFLSWVRGQTGGEAVPLAVVSSRFDGVAIDSARKAGAFAYVVKPIRFESLLQALAALGRGDPMTFEVIDR